MPQQLQGVGLGLRRELLSELSEQLPTTVNFLELAPENWLRVGGRRIKHFNKLAERYPLVCHGLSLSLGAPAPLDIEFLDEIKTFLKEYDVALYSEHLSYCSDESQLYDLMPIPFTSEAVTYVAKRIRQTQDILQRRIAIENVSYYYTPNHELTELEFITAVLQEADCDLLLDVNNIYVNSVNHGYDAAEFLMALQHQPIAYIHMAGHYQLEANLIIDTHGGNITAPVWQLLALAYRQFGKMPTLLERDTDIPPLDNLLQEVEKIRELQESIKLQEVAHG